MTPDDWRIRLEEKPAPVRKIRDRDGAMAGHDNYLYRRPPISYRVGELQSVHRDRHVHPQRQLILYDQDLYGCYHSGCSNVTF